MSAMESEVTPVRTSDLAARTLADRWATAEAGEAAPERPPVAAEQFETPEAAREAIEQQYGEPPEDLDLGPATPEAEPEAAAEPEPEVDDAPWRGTVEEWAHASGVDISQVLVRREVGDEVLEVPLTDVLSGHYDSARLESDRTRWETEREGVQRALGQRMAQLDNAMQQVALAAQSEEQLVGSLEAEIGQQINALQSQRHMLDPGEYAAQWAEQQGRLQQAQGLRNQLQANREQAIVAYQQQMAAANQEMERNQATARTKLRPEWRDPDVYRRERAEIDEYVLRTFPTVAREEMAAEHNPVIETLAWKAMKYDEMRDRQREIRDKGVAAVRPVAGAPARTPQQVRRGAARQREDSLTERARSTNTQRDAAAVLSHRWEQETR
jgi:hypothetical protein